MSIEIKEEVKTDCHGNDVLSTTIKMKSDKCCKKESDHDDDHKDDDKKSSDEKSDPAEDQKPKDVGKK